MKRLLSFLTALCLLLPYAMPVQAQSSALRHLLRYKRPATGGVLTTSGLILQLEADDLSTQFQDIAGATAVTANGDVVGKWNDKSGNAFHVTAPADDTTRATHIISGALHRNSCDGINDVFQRASALGLWANGAGTIMVAFRNAATDSGSIIGEGNNVATSPLFDAINVPAADFNDLRTLSRNSAATAIINNPTMADEAIQSGVDIVYTLTWDGSTLSAYVDNGTPVTSAYTPSGDFSGLNRFAICGDAKGLVPGGFYQIEISGVWAWNRVVNSTERGNDFTYAKAKQGR